MSFSLSRLMGPTIRIEISDKPDALDPAPITPEWIIEGQPEARASAVSSSSDTFTSTFMWSCTAGRFHWHFDDDETVHILEGEVLVTDDDGNTRRLGPGAVALFRKGSHSIWHVPVFVKKIAFIYSPVPAALSLAVRALRKMHALMTGGGKKRGIAA